MPDYNEYHYEKEEICFYGICYIGLLVLIVYTFYKSYIALFLLSPLVYFLLKKQKKKLCEKQKKRLLEQFREMVLSVSANLKAGYSIENAFAEAYQDIAMLYGKESMMAKELGYLLSGLRNNMILEDMLTSFAKRSGMQDIKDFAEIFCIAKRSGGDMNSIIRNTSNTIGEKIQVRREIDTMIHAKEFEQKIMNMIPFGIIFYINLTSPGFFTPLYHNIKGNVVMSVCLIVYALAVCLSEKLIRIEV